MSEINAYLYQARLQVKTDRDREELTRLEQAIAFIREAMPLSNHLTDGMESLNSEISSEAARLEGTHATAVDASRFKEQYTRRLNEERSKETQENARINRMFERAASLIQSVQGDLGIPVTDFKSYEHN